MRTWLGSAWARRRVRIAAVVLAYLVASLEWGALIFHFSCADGAAERDPPYAPPEVQVWMAKYPEYKRTEESTYLTLLEWYQVFSYQEYASYYARADPSDFPYGAAVSQSWSMYCHAYAHTEGTYPFNAGNHLMLFVIGTSFAAEYYAKGFYENTWGRLWGLAGHTSEEDVYAAAVARDYAEFTEREPWYAYPFGSKLVGVWTGNDFFGHEFPRKMERKVFLTYEYGWKAVYASLIKGATGAIYGAPPAQDYLWIENATDSALTVAGVEVVEELGNGGYVIVLPHYQGFTDAVPELAREGVVVRDIAGNDLIVLTGIAPRGWTYQLDHGEELFRKDIPTDSGHERVVVRSPVADLHRVILGLEAQDVRVEHLFDY